MIIFVKMKINFVSILLLILSCNASSENICDLSLQSLEAISKSVRFLRFNYVRIDVDGLYGFQLLENYLHTIPRHSIEKKCHKNSKKIFSKLFKQKMNLSKIIEMAIKVVAKKYKNYYYKMLSTMNSFKNVRHTWKLLHANHRGYNFQVLPAKSAAFYNEEKGDSCMKEITDNCSISNSCYNLFVGSPIGEEYIATHQAIYLELYIENKCFLKHESHINVSDLKMKLEDVCVNLLATNRKILVGETEVNKMTADLFLEIVVICGGQFRYLDFLTHAAFNFVQKIQNPNGCFEVKNFKNTISKRAMRSISNKLHVVERRRSKTIAGCSSHTLGLGAASNGAFLQKFLMT